MHRRAIADERRAVRLGGWPQWGWLMIAGIHQTFEGAQQGVLFSGQTEIISDACAKGRYGQIFRASAYGQEHRDGAVALPNGKGNTEDLMAVRDGKNQQTGTRSVCMAIKLRGAGNLSHFAGQGSHPLFAKGLCCPCRAVEKNYWSHLALAVLHCPARLCVGGLELQRMTLSNPGLRL